jgi:hypothetical protein
MVVCAVGAVVFALLAWPKVLAVALALIAGVALVHVAGWLDARH